MTEPVADGFALALITLVTVWGLTVPIRFALRMLGIIE
jgi:hypothetical protein